MTKAVEKQKAMQLRRLGYSYAGIASRLSVSKSTLSEWLGDMPYVPNKETVERIGKAHARSGEVKAKQKRESILQAKREAVQDVGVITERDLFMLGLGLYMGEGTKSHGLVRIINANPSLIRLALAWFQQACGLTMSNFSIRIHLYPDNSIVDSIEFWSKTTGIPKNRFQKTQVDARLNKKVTKRGKLPYGTAHVTVKSNGNKRFGVFLSRKVNAWMDEAIKLAGIV